SLHSSSSHSILLSFPTRRSSDLRSVMFWLLGSLALGQWDLTLPVTFAVVLIITIILWCLGPRIDALTIGDDAALTLGINPDRMRAILVALVCIVVGAVVAMAASMG